MKIKMVIFDWAGTTVDYGCFAPVDALRTAFSMYQIAVSEKAIREPMGMAKIDHIKAMLKMPDIAKAFYDVYDRNPNGEDARRIYDLYRVVIMQSLAQFSTLTPYVQECVAWLREHDIVIGSTTSYTDQMMEVVTAVAKQNGYEPDACFSTDSSNGYGKPYPYMIFRNMEKLGVAEVRSVIKVGDTITDIREGKNAGVYTVGVMEGSAEIGMSKEAYEALSATEKQKRIAKAGKRYLCAGADAVILNLSELPGLIARLEAKEG